MIRLFGIAAFLALAIVACGANDLDGSVLDNADLDARSDIFSLDSDGCGINIPDLDETFLSALPDCENGAGKCVPPSPVTPATITKLLAPCDGGTCVPTMFLRVHREPLRTCTSFGKAAGVCVSQIVPTIQKLTFLPQDACKSDERCAPCTNPIDGKVTGICEIGKPGTKPADECAQAPSPACPYAGKPLLDPSRLAPCGTDQGMHCLPKKVVPAKLAPLLAPCPDATMLCAPDKASVAVGQFVPKACTALAGAEGRCLHEDLPQVAAQADLLSVDTCDPYERCTPCFDPLSGDALPSCTIACDVGPTKPPVVFPTCKGGIGRCVPIAVVPTKLQGNLTEQDCKKGTELCVPTMAIDRKTTPATCDVLLFGFPKAGPGVCVEDVLSIGFVLAKSNCKDGFKCTPCNNPLQNDEPTGLPGCPK